MGRSDETTGIFVFDFLSVSLVILYLNSNLIFDKGLDGKGLSFWFKWFKPVKWFKVNGIWQMMLINGKEKCSDHIIFFFF